MAKSSVSYDPGTPTAARFVAPNLIQQDSWRGQPASYIQDLAGRTCSCPDFQHRRADKAPEDASRLCKHLAALLTAPALAAPTDEAERQARDAALKALFG